MLNGVDISGHDEGIYIPDVEADFIIVKSTEGLQGTRYNRGYRDMADSVLSTGRLLGFYHYANGENPEAEAESFWESVRDYRGKAVLALDWEGAGNHLFLSGQDASWCRRFLDRLATLSGSTPLIYTGQSACNEIDWSECAKYPLWGAAYASNDDVYGYDGDPWRPRYGWGAWGSNPLIRQYTPALVLERNGGIYQFDGNLFYGDRADWEWLCGKPEPKQESSNAENNAGLIYQAHVQDIGWCDAVHDGMVAGTVGFAKRLEALRFTAIPAGWTIRAKLHVQNVGWVTQDVRVNESIGTVGRGQAIECVMFEVVGKPSGDGRNLWFRVHQQDRGWKSWTPAPYASGTDGMGKRIEAMQIKIG